MESKEERGTLKSKIGEMITSIAGDMVEKEKVADIPEKYRMKGDGASSAL